MKQSIIIVSLIVFFVNSTTVFTDQDLMILMERSQIRGDYQDIINERSGALISNARDLTFYGDQFNNSPLRDAIYDIVSGTKGYVLIPVTKNIQLDLLQAYEINTVTIWTYDLSAITYSFELILVNVDNTTNVVDVNTAANAGLYRKTFQDSIVKSIIIKNTSSTQPLQIIKLQAFYAF